MRSRSFFSVVAFVVTFAFSTGLVWLAFGLPESAPARASIGSRPGAGRYASGIENLVRQDVTNGNERVGRMSFLARRSNLTLADRARAVQDYARVSGAMSTDGLPQDFVDAWQRHMMAWRDYSRFLNETANMSRDGRMADFARITEDDRRYDADISATWYELLRIGRSYGANVY